MSLESASFISGLDATNPTAGDQTKQGDDHLRLIKGVLQACFPNADKACYFPDSATKTGNYTVLAADMNKRLLGDASGGAFNITLPTLAAADDGWSIWIIKSDSSTNALTIVGTVNGAANPTISKQYQGQFVLWSGTAWYTVGGLGDPMSFVSKDAGATAGPTLDLFRDSASPAVSDFLGTIDLNGRDSAANKQLYAQIGAQIADPTSTSEDAIIILRAVIAGVLTDMLQSNASGILVPGTLNANGNFAINTNKATIAAATGNTVLAGTLDVTGAITGVAAISGASVAGAMVATQAEQETATAVDRVVSPGRQHFHPGMPKAWVSFTATTGAINASYNVASVTRNSAGNYTIAFTTAFSSANYVVLGTCSRTTNTDAIFAVSGALSAGSFVCKTFDIGATVQDFTRVFVACFGDL